MAWGGSPARGLLTCVVFSCRWPYSRRTWARMPFEKLPISRSNSRRESLSLALAQFSLIRFDSQGETLNLVKGSSS